MKVAYVVSRFPVVTETFIVREMNGVAAAGEVDIELFALFPTTATVIHESSQPWISACRHGSVRRGLRATLGWLVRSPRRTTRVLAEVAWDYRCDPPACARALTSTIIALDHARTMRALGVDHVHAHFATYPALAAYVAHRLLGVTYSITPHAHDIFVSQAGLRRRLHNASRVVAISRYNWMFLQHFGARPAQLVLSYYGVDLRRLRFGGAAPRAGARPEIVMVSSMRESKGHRFLIDALAADDRLAEATVEFIGDGPLRAEIEHHASSRGIEQRCTFSGARDEDYVRARVAAALILVQPSVVQADGDTEGLPNTVIEAAALGTVVVASRVTGIPELVEDGVSGFLAEPASSLSLADAIHRALTLDAAGRDAMLDEARHRVAERHDVDRAAATMSDLFRASVHGP